MDNIALFVSVLRRRELLFPRCFWCGFRILPARLQIRTSGGAESLTTSERSLPRAPLRRELQIRARSESVPLGVIMALDICISSHV